MNATFFNFMHSYSWIFFVVVIVIMRLIFIGTISMIFSPKLQGKMMARQMKAIKHATEFGAKSIEDTIANVGGAVAEGQSKLYDNHGDTIRNNTRRSAEIEAEALRIKADAVKDVVGEIISGARGSGAVNSSQRAVYCRHCGRKIEADSRFCKYCGKEQ